MSGENVETLAKLGSGASDAWATAKRNIGEWVAFAANQLGIVGRSQEEINEAASKEGAARRETAQALIEQQSRMKAVADASKEAAELQKEMAATAKELRVAQGGTYGSDYERANEMVRKEEEFYKQNLALLKSGNPDEAAKAINDENVKAAKEAEKTGQTGIYFGRDEEEAQKFHRQRIFAIDSENRALIDQREHQKRIKTEEQESNKLKGEAKTMLEAAMKPLDKYAETVAKIRDLEKKRYLDAEQAQKLEKKAAEDLKNAQAKEQGHMGEAYVRGTMEEYTERMRLEQEAGQRLRQAASAQSANGPNRAEERTATATEQLPAKLDIIAARLQSLSAPGSASEPAMVWR